MVKVNLMGANFAAQIRIVEDTILKASCPETFVFTLEYYPSCKAVCEYAVLRGYSASAKKIDNFKFEVTIGVENAMEETLVDIAMSGCDSNDSYTPEYVDFQH